MEYKYVLEDKATKNVNFNNIESLGILNILCYHVETQCKYPFLQFMMEKIPYCDNIVKEQLIMPYIFIRDPFKNIGELVLEKIKSGLDSLNCEYNKVTEDMYKGILFSADGCSSYALVNITGIDIYGLNFSRQSIYWFALPSEIINTKQVCNIDINSDIICLFSDTPKLGCLTNANTNETFIIPDAVYTGSELKQSEFYSVFGNTKKKIYESCGEYYYFYRSFENSANNRCVNRYALFVEGKIYLETMNEFALTDDIIESSYPEPCIIICYSVDNNKPDMLVKNYESFVCLSYHKLNKNLLDEYMIE